MDNIDDRRIRLMLKPNFEKKKKLTSNEILQSSSGKLGHQAFRYLGVQIYDILFLNYKDVFKSFDE